VHGVGRGALGPQHVGRIEHDGQRSTDVGTAQPARRDVLDVGAAERLDHLVDGGLLESVQQCSDGFVQQRDAGHRRGAGDDADLVGVIAGVVRLPQRVAAPPAPDILVDDRHEIDRLPEGLAQSDEEGHVRRMQLNGRSVRVVGDQGGDGLLRVLQQGRVGPKQRLDRAEIVCM
jgi:hypothetical protein